MGIRHAVVGLLPKHWELPLRYAYTNLGGRIDHEAKLLASHVRPGSSALDIGAHAGLISYLMAKSGAGRVDAFEPLSRWRDVLQAWAATDARIHVHAVACSDAPGKLTLHVPRSPQGKLLHSRASVSVPSGPHISETVRSATVDELVAEQGISDVSAIKIDVEGHEDAVLRGAEGLLRRDHPALMIEIERRHRDAPPERAFEYLRSLGYDGFFCNERGVLSSVAQFNADSHQREPGSATYINNFLFFESGQKGAGR